MLEILVFVIQQCKVHPQLISQVATIVSSTKLSQKNKIVQTFNAIHGYSSSHGDEIFKELNNQFFACISRTNLLSTQIDDARQYLDLMYHWVLYKLKTANEIAEIACGHLFRFRTGSIHYSKLVTMILQFIFLILKTFKCEERIKQLVLKHVLLRSEDERDRMEECNDLIAAVQAIIEYLTVSKSAIRFYKVLGVIHDYEQKVKGKHFPNPDPFNDKNLQIMLAPFFHYVRIRRDRLKSMVTLHTHYAKCPIFCHHLDSFQGPAQILGSVQSLSSLENDILFQITASEPRVGSVEWNRKVTQLVAILSQQANPEIFAYFLSQETLLSRSSETKDSKQKYFVPNFTAAMLNEAIVYRILQLVNERETVPLSHEDMFKDVSQGVIGKWILFADQVYSMMLQFKEIDFRKIIIGEGNLFHESMGESPMSLNKALNLYGDTIKDHFVIWIILQIMPLFAQYSGTHNLTSELLNLISELMHRKFTSWKPHEQELIHYNYLFIMQRLANLKEINFVGKFMSKHVQKWREETEKTLDYYNLDELALKNLFLLSSYLTQPISSEIIEFLRSPERKPDVVDVDDQTDLTRIPNAGLILPKKPHPQVNFKGKRRPLSPNLLFILSAHSRKKLFDSLEEIIYEKDQKEALSPSLIETFVRLLYCSPSFYCSSYKLTQNYGHMEIHSKFMVIEMVSFRLMRFFKYTSTENVIRILGNHLKIWVDSSTNDQQNFHRLYLTLENLFLKVMLYLVNDISKLHTFVVRFKTDLKNRFGEAVRRLIVFSTARILKLRGITGFVNMEGANQIMKVLIEYCPDIFNDILYSDSRMQLYTASLKSSFDKRKAQLPVNKTNRPTHLNEITLTVAQQNMNLIRELIERASTGKLSVPELEQNIAVLRNQLTLKDANPLQRHSLLSSLWMYIYHNKPEISPILLEHLKILLNTSQSAIEYNTNIFRFINFLLDEFIPDLTNSSSDDSSDPSKQLVEPYPTYLVSVAQCLSTFIWQYEFLPIETVIQAMVDRAGSHKLGTDPLSTQIESRFVIPLLNHLLLVDGHLSDRVNFYIQQDVHVNHWEEEDYFAKHARYHDKYPETWGINTIKQATKKHSLPSYFGNVCLRMIPIFDILLRRLVEVGENQFLIAIIDKYEGLLAYHDNLITFVKHMFMYNCDSPHPFIFDYTVQRRLVQLAILGGANFSKELMYWITPGQSEQTTIDVDLNDKTDPARFKAFYTPQYFVNCIRYAASVMPSISRSSANDVSPKDRFQEFPTMFEKRVNELVIEFLSLPIKLMEVIQILMSSVTRSCEFPEEFDFASKIDSYRMCSCLGVILASLPQPLTSQYVIDNIRQFLLSNNNIRLSDQITISGELPSKGVLQSEQHVGNNYVDNQETALLTVLHAFFSNASLESVNVLRYFFPECYAASKSRLYGGSKSDQPQIILNMKHMHFLARLVGPLVNLLRQSPFASSSSSGTSSPLNILERFFMELVKCLCSVVDSPKRSMVEILSESVCGDQSKSSIERITGKKRTFDEMNEGDVLDSFSHSIIFPVLHMELSQASLPIYQSKDEGDSHELYEQVYDLLQHMHYLLYANGQMQAQIRSQLVQDIQHSCVNPAVKLDLINMILA